MTAFSAEPSSRRSERDDFQCPLWVRSGNSAGRLRFRLALNSRRLWPCQIKTIELLDGEGIVFQSVTEAMDTTTPGGRLPFHICGALAEFERGIIRERTAAGLVAARSQGRTGGAKRKLDETAKREARALLAIPRKHSEKRRGALWLISGDPLSRSSALCQRLNVVAGSCDRRGLKNLIPKIESLRVI